MPIYTYKCLKCNSIKDIWQKWNDKAPICSNCNKTMKKIPVSFEVHGYMSIGREKAAKTFENNWVGHHKHDN